ncbi:hypothetical protein GCM10007862_30620 [Dyella lipolytica]|nr:hypothetical protein GCM10007862_30620 [Dyella lipolytica]
MGEFAIGTGVRYQTGNQHGDRSQLTALGVDREAFFKTFGDAIDAMIHRHRPRQEQNCKRSARENPAQVDSAFNISRSDVEPKSRWVDGTPEYSFYIYGLTLLFPHARFVHIVRDVRSVVDSMLNFKQSACKELVKTEQQAYEYWLRTVQACVQAERALGPRVVHRLRYDDLVHRPEWAIRGVLEFLGEPFMAPCIEPLARRINSSEVPNGFCAVDPRTNPAVVEQAIRLSEQLQRPFEEGPLSPGELADLKARFDRRVAFMSELDTEYALGQEKVCKLSKRLDRCGLILVCYFLLALVATAPGVLRYGWWQMNFQNAVWLVGAVAGLAFYVTLRRAGLRSFVIGMIHRCGWHRRAGDAGLHKLKNTFRNADVP